MGRLLSVFRQPTNTARCTTLAASLPFVLDAPTRRITCFGVCQHRWLNCVWFMLNVSRCAPHVDESGKHRPLHGSIFVSHARLTEGRPSLLCLSFDLFLRSYPFALLGFFSRFLLFFSMYARPATNLGHIFSDIIYLPYQHVDLEAVICITLSNTATTVQQTVQQ